MKNKLTIALLLFIFIAVSLSLVNLFWLRFRTGDSLPHYSSMRADPLGTKALYNSLEKIEGLDVSRNYATYDRYEVVPNTTLFLIGSSPWALTYTGEGPLEKLDQIAMEGGRVVVAIKPISRKSWYQDYDSDDDSPDKDKEEEKDKDKGKKEDKSASGEKTSKKKAARTDGEKKKTDDKKENRPEKPSSMTDHWGFETGYLDVPVNTIHNVPARKKIDAELPESLPWHSIFYFNKLSKPWKVVYTYRHQPVIIERPFGRGSIVLCADSYLFSNEALRNDPKPELLAWLTGPVKSTRQPVVFDEVHLGLNESPGIAALGRKYRLHGLMAGFIVLAMLFVWKNAFSLTPARESDEDSGVYTSRKDYTAGLISLLRRNIPSKKIMKTCIDEWERSYASKQKNLAPIIQRVKEAAQHETDQVETYKKIHSILDEGKKKWNKAQNT